MLWFEIGRIMIRTVVGCLGRGCECSGPNRAGNFLSSRITAAFSGRTQLYGMCYLLISDSLILGEKSLKLSVRIVL